MEKNKVKKNISIIITVAVIILGLWFIIIYPLIRFNENEKIVDFLKKEKLVLLVLGLY